MKTRFYVIFGIISSLLTIFFVLGPSQGHIAEYFLTDEQFEDMILGDTPHMSDSRNTGNPTECWYQEDDGSMTSCTIDSTGPSMVIGMGLVIFWPYVVLGIASVIIFIVWKKRK